MNRAEIKRRLQQSAEAAQSFWDGVKERMSPDGLDQDESFECVDIQEISDDCVDLIMVRRHADLDLDQMDHWRFVAESRLFRKPKIKVYFTAGPFKSEFDGKTKVAGDV